MAEIEIEPLPDCLWEKIFSLLPLSSSISSRTVCRRWNSIITGEIFASCYIGAAPSRVDQIDDVHFLLFADLETSAAYRPSTDRWFPFSLPRFRRILASGGALLLLEKVNSALSVFNLFSGKGKEIPPVIPSQNQSYVLGLIDLGSEENFRIVSVANSGRVISQVFDPHSGNWAFRGELSGQFAVLGNSCYLDGILYSLSRAPDHLLAFDSNSGDWAIVDAGMPSSRVVCPHILAHRGSIILIGGLEEAGEISEICMWELELEEERWRELGSMPREIFGEFRGSRLDRFNVVDRRGLVCFCNTSDYLALMCDLRRMRWWWASNCSVKIAMDAETWVGLALEPHVGVLR